MSKLQPDVDRHAILGFEKQLHLLDVVGDASWWVNLDDGTLTFGGELVIRAGLLGTEASGSWLWGWANPGGFAEPVIAAARAACDYGREHDLPALCEPESALSADVTLDRIGLVVAGALELPATYTGALDEDVRVLLALEHPSLALPAPEPVRLAHVLAVVLQAGFVEDWPGALEAYAAQRGLSFDGKTLGGVEVTLDQRGRIVSIRT